MQAVHVPVLAGSCLLLLAGAYKLRNPAPATRAIIAVTRHAGSRYRQLRWAVRAFSIGELAVAAGVLFTDARVALGAQTVLFLLFAVFVVASLASAVPMHSCGCFGVVDAAPSLTHVAINVALSGLALVVLTDRALGPPRETLLAPWGVGLFATLATTGAVMLLVRPRKGSNRGSDQ